MLSYKGNIPSFEISALPPRIILPVQAGHTLAYLAAHHGHADVLKVLHEHGADLAATTRVRGLLHAFNLDMSNRHQMTLWRTVMRSGLFTI